ncbi:chloroplastic lipocalin [Magnolia sinica]|uniref:chloroplastic lipocalin n=1 Tax=Magnolia sinica TaxID=86752 RepID=UPI00265AE27D|nr:chloroplastic lipocalin [Magnolia sinica]
MDEKDHRSKSKFRRIRILQGKREKESPEASTRSAMLLQASPLLLQPPSFSRRICSLPEKRTLKCALEYTKSSKEAVAGHVFSGLAASFIFLSQPNQVIAAESTHYNNFCQLAIAANPRAPLQLDGMSDERGGKLMMSGMTAKNFDPVRYSGRWFEVASLKRGFAGQGQEDCHCTQGIYTFDAEAPSIRVDTFCVHGGPDGYITGIRGNVQCLSEEDTEKQETDLERQEMIREKCYLRFPTLPFIPKEPYDVIATDYDNFALVSGAKDRSFIQIYSRTPVPGSDFVEKYKSYLENYGYDANKIKDTPQDCEVMSSGQLALMMSMPGMQKALTNQFPGLELKSSFEFNPFTSVFDTLKKLLELYFK